MTPGVDVNERSARKAWRDAGYHDVWLQLRTEQSDDVAIGQAINRTNDAEMSTGVFAELHTPTPSGYAVMVSGFVDDDHFSAWLSRFATDLALFGFAGTLEGVGSPSPPRWMTADATPTPTAFFAWTWDPDEVVLDQYRMSGWHVAPPASAAITHFAADWTQPGGDEITLYSGSFAFPVADPSTIADTLCSSVTRGGMAAVVRYSRNGERARIAFLNPGGGTVAQELDASVRWPDRIDALREVITALPHHLDQAFVRPAIPYSTGWTSIADGQPLDGLHESDVRYNRHLLADYAADAHGLQVLTDSHLRKAHDLASWTVRDLGGGRHLVEAPDLEPWYAGALPDPDVVRRARHDFGAILLSKDVIAAHPAPRTAPP